MFNAVSAAAEEVAGPAISSRGTRHALGNFVPIGRVVSFAVALEDNSLRSRVACTGRKLFICIGLFVANQAIDPGLVCKVKIIVLPTITGMTGCATSLVAFDVHSEVVDGQTAFAEATALCCSGVEPGPVDGFVKLQSRFRMAGQTCFSHFRSRFEFLLQGFVL